MIWSHCISLMQIPVILSSLSSFLDLFKLPGAAIVSGFPWSPVWASTVIGSPAIGARNLLLPCASGVMRMGPILHQWEQSSLLSACQQGPCLVGWSGKWKGDEKREVGDRVWKMGNSGSLSCGLSKLGTFCPCLDPLTKEGNGGFSQSRNSWFNSKSLCWIEFLFLITFGVWFSVRSEEISSWKVVCKSECWLNCFSVFPK